jgi:hypothetical protein
MLLQSTATSGGGFLGRGEEEAQNGRTSSAVQRCHTSAMHLMYGENVNVRQFALRWASE